MTICVAVHLKITDVRGSWLIHSELRDIENFRAHSHLNRYKYK